EYGGADYKEPDYVTVAPSITEELVAQTEANVVDYFPEQYGEVDYGYQTDTPALTTGPNEKTPVDETLVEESIVDESFVDEPFLEEYVTGEDYDSEKKLVE
ncbi:unnamed protein product, partial [Staurois parvus]